GAPWAEKCGAWSCRSAMFTDTPTSHEAARQAAPWAHTLRSTHSPSATISPESSATAGNPRGGQLHDRLVLQLKLFARDRPLQVARHVQAAHHVRVHVRGVDLDPAA